MIGWVYLKGDPEPPCESDGVHFCPVCVARGDGLGPRLSSWFAAYRLRRAGVRRAVLPHDWLFQTSFERHGIAAVLLSPLYRATAAAIIRCCMAGRGIKPERATILLVAKRVTLELRNAAKNLCADTRYLALLTEEGGEALSRELALCFGVALRLCAQGEAPCADLTVCFDSYAAWPDALRLDETLRVTYNDRRSTELLAALWSAGVLDVKELSVRETVYEPPSRVLSVSGS